MDTLKKISIKSNTVKRYYKDINYYRKELQSLLAKQTSLQADPETCPHTLSKHAEIIKETESMIPDCENRLEASRADLQEFLNDHCNGEIDTSSEIYKEASVLLLSQ